MPTSLDPITEEELRPGDSRGRLGTIRKLAAMYNAWLNPQIRHDTGKEDVQFSDSNVVFEYLQGGGGGSNGGTGSPTPFQLIQTKAGTNAFTFNPNSYLRADPTSFTNTGITGIDATYALAEGDQGYIQFDASDDGSSLEEASIVKSQDGPGASAVTVGGSGTSTDPFIWNQSFLYLFQVFAADASGNPSRGGIVYTVDSAGTKLEVVQSLFQHLSMKMKFSNGAICQQATPDAGPQIS